MKKFLAIVLILIPAISYAAEKPDWFESEGEAIMGEYDTKKDVVEKAKRDAQNKAVERAVGVFIKSHTLVSNSQLAEDLVYAAARGKIEKVNIITEGWDEKDRNLYRVKLKALIKPVYPEKGEGISLKMSLSKTALKEGEEVKIFYQPSSDCYIYIFSIAADGSVTLLLPNSSEQNNFIQASKAYKFPPDNSKIRLQALFIPGEKRSVVEERIKVIATKKKEDIISLGFQEGMFKVYDANSTGLVSDLVRKLNQLDPTEWTEATAVYKLER